MNTKVSRFAGLKLLAAFLFMLSVVGPGCFTNSVIDEFSTDMLLPAPGELAGPIEIRKRYRFSQDPHQAEGIEIVRLSIQVVPEGYDLAMIQRLVLYAEIETGELIPLGTAESFMPGERIAEVDILFVENLADLVRSDGRLVLVWYLEPNVWYAGVPIEGIEILGRAVMEITL